MTHHDDHLRDAELGPVIDRLRAERPTASALELDSIKQRVRARDARPRRTAPMRSRLAIIGMLALGGVLSTGGAGLAVSGFAGSSGNAAVEQYGSASPSPSGSPGGGGNVLGESEGGGGGSRPAAGGGGNGPAVAGQQAGSGAQPTRQVEAGAQASTGNQQLPFTGFAAMPVLLLGVAMILAGMILRRRLPDRS